MLTRQLRFLTTLLLIPSVALALSILAVGDIVPGNGFFPDSSVHLSADILFGNLEGCICDSPGTPKPCGSLPASCFKLRSSSKIIPTLTVFSILNLANNHVNDYGPECRKQTMQLLEDSGIARVGLLEYPDTILPNSVAFAGFAPNIGTCDIKNIPRAGSAIAVLARQAPIVVVSFHAGAEGASKQHVTRKTETFCRENRGNPWQFAHTVIDSGADLVIGHGPHVTRAYELYKRRLILYSLGNFYADGPINLKGPNGKAPMATIELDPDGVLIRAVVTSISNPGCKADPKDSALIILRKLAKEDKLGGGRWHGDTLYPR